MFNIVCHNSLETKCLNTILICSFNTFLLTPLSHALSIAGPFVPGCADLMTEYSRDGCFVRFYYPTSLDHIKVVSKEWSKIIKCIPDALRCVAIAEFRLLTSHNCLPHYLYRIGIIPSPLCMLCDQLERNHLMSCPALTKKTLISRYWENRSRRNNGEKFSLALRLEPGFSALCADALSTKPALKENREIELKLRRIQSGIGTRIRCGLVDKTSACRAENPGNCYIPVVWNADVRKEGAKLPVVILSHGLGASRFLYSSICVELASHGFLVAAVEHRDKSASASFYYKSKERQASSTPSWVNFKVVRFGSGHFPERSKQTKTIVVVARRIKKVNLRILNEAVEQVSSFKYLGCTVSSNMSCCQEVKRRIAVAKEAFTGNRERSIFCGPLEKKLRKRLVKCFVWNVALYGAETWILGRNEEKRIEAFEMWIWRRMEHVSKRVEECRRLLDLLEKINDGSPIKNILTKDFKLSQLKGRLNLENLTMMGHSFGGATALLTLENEPRLKYGVILDPWMFPLKEEPNLWNTVKQPLLFINTETFHITTNYNALKKYTDCTPEGCGKRTVYTLKYVKFYFTCNKFDGHFKKIGCVMPKLHKAGRIRTVHTLKFDEEVLHHFRDDPSTSTRRVIHKFGVDQHLME
ncbi:hypothetical protein ANN_14267 [Periplaneta americana]|uniref:1-alkyl-2-acetylglycerophosphocholine esterase n=1 Tax=Periplaneta americana TaxID=6978 RepID=A0ABQ8SVU5_PERAM|nr:hypothetical protein ANN_14267 [Periplaneta americana]